jgi:hypothetical protein
VVDNGFMTNIANVGEIRGATITWRSSNGKLIKTVPAQVDGVDTASSYRDAFRLSGAPRASLKVAPTETGRARPELPVDDYLNGTVTGPGALEYTAMKSRSSGVR